MKKIILKTSIFNFKLRIHVKLHFGLDLIERKLVIIPREAFIQLLTDDFFFLPDMYHII
jgi:hypothetical protein